jgi:crossover junction endodeoxyribonuclease RusA
MPKRIELTLPEPPSVNRIWRTGKGRTYKDKKAVLYGEAVLACALKAGVKQVAFREGVAVKYTMTWHRGRKSGDLSNRLKVLEDALNGIVWADDKQVVELHCYRTDAPKQGRVTILIEAAE